MCGKLIKHITLLSFLILFFTKLNAQEIPDFGTPKKLSFEVNSAGLESAPFFYGNRMYFSRHLHDGNKGGKESGMDVWYSDYNPSNNSWSKANSDMGPINDKNHNAVIGISADGNTLYLANRYHGKGYAKPGISYSKKEGNTWSVPENIDIPGLIINGQVCGFFMDKSERILFISYNGPKSFGQEDLYISIKGDSAWSEPVNLGSTINDAGYQISPFLADDGKTLYFASSGESRGSAHGSDGHADIYVSHKLDNTYTSWSTPVNLGDKINTSEFEGYFVKPEGEYYYFVRSGAETGDDIYRVKIGEDEEEMKALIVKGIVFDEISKEPLSVKITIKDSEGNKKVEVLKVDDDGHYELELERAKTYVFHILEKGYHEHHDEVIMPTINDSVNELEYNFPMKKLLAGTKIEVEHLYFIVSTDTLRESSVSGVDKLAQILINNPELKIEIQGHTDNSGSYSANRKLSENRAKTIKKLLAERGIKKKRLKTVGYGSSKPLVKNLTEEDKKKNRRVDFVIID